MFFCYILECADGSLYVGVTDDPAQRVRHHNEGKGSTWTASRRPVTLVWTEDHRTLSAARKRENQLKRWSLAKKVALIGGSPRLRSGQTHSETE
ncbi:MAG: GIY-YIG nuclease family protein [Candidatus Acidiferrales bacterium]